MLFVFFYLPFVLCYTQSADAAEKGCIGKHRDGRRLEMEGTAEDRLLLAGLRRLDDCDGTPGEGCGPASPTHGKLTALKICFLAQRPISRILRMCILLASLAINAKAISQKK